VSYVVGRTEIEGFVRGGWWRGYLVWDGGRNRGMQKIL